MRFDENVVYESCWVPLTLFGGIYMGLKLGPLNVVEQIKRSKGWNFSSHDSFF
jgi:hypothetical protein